MLPALKKRLRGALETLALLARRPLQLAQPNLLVYKMKRDLLKRQQQGFTKGMHDAQSLSLCRTARYACARIWPSLGTVRARRPNAAAAERSRP